MTTHNEDIWTCTDCGNQFGRHDMYFDGKCGSCNSASEDRENDLRLYGMTMGAIVVWETADDEKIMGKIVDIEEEADDEGHFLKLKNIKGGIDNVPMSLVACFRCTDDSEWIFDHPIDLDSAELDRLASSLK